MQNIFGFLKSLKFSEIPQMAFEQNVLQDIERKAFAERVKRRSFFAGQGRRALPGEN